jgi:hypothetical protein
MIWLNLGKEIASKAFNATSAVVSAENAAQTGQ